MPQHLRQLRLAAVNIDGVLLNDTFSPVIHHFVVSRGGTYTADVERAVFSQSRTVAARAIADAAKLDWPVADVLKTYFEEREEYLSRHPIRLLDGAVDLLRAMRSLGLRTVCYGGLDASHFQRYLGEHVELFDPPRYMCTNDFRPGLREISETFHLMPDRVLFIDDVARVAEVAKELGAAFVGHPSSFPHGFQPRLMHEAGVRHIVSSPTQIDTALLRALDEEAAEGVLWSTD